MEREKERNRNVLDKIEIVSETKRPVHPGLIFACSKSVNTGHHTLSILNANGEKGTLDSVEDERPVVTAVFLTSKYHQQHMPRK